MAELTFPSPTHLRAVQEYWDLFPIDYALLGLAFRGRLHLRRRTLRRKPLAFGEGPFTRFIATMSKYLHFRYLQHPDRTLQAYGTLPSTTVFDESAVSGSWLEPCYIFRAGRPISELTLSLKDGCFTTLPHRSCLPTSFAT